MVGADILRDVYGIQAYPRMGAAWVYVDIQDRDLGGFVKDAKAILDKELRLPAGYSLAWSGQFEYFERAAKRLSYVVPMT